MLVDIQNDMLDILQSRLVIPLTLTESNDGTYPANLCPTLVIQDQTYFLLTHLMASIPTKVLIEFQCSIKGSRYAIVRAIDFAVTGV